MMTLKRLFTVFFALFLISHLHSSAPELTSEVTHSKIQEILAAHYKHKKLTINVLKRSLDNFIHDLDPSKTIFLKSETDAFLNPSADDLNALHREVLDKDYSRYLSQYQTFAKALARRESAIKRISADNYSKNPTSSRLEYKEYPQSEDELNKRLVDIRSLQLASIAKLKDDNKGQLMTKLDKYRKSRYQEYLGNSTKEQTQMAYAYTIKAIASALDTQTHYFTPKEAEQFLMQMQQKLQGIGAQLRDDLEGLTITCLVEGGPAERSKKLKVGDLIIGVNKEPIIGMHITDAVELIRGPKKSKVLLTIERQEEVDGTKVTKTFDCEIERDEVIFKEARLSSKAYPFGNGVIGHIKLNQFYQDDKQSTSSSAADLQRAITKMKTEHHIHGLILDLRGNTGGLLTQAVDVSGIFMKRGIVVSVKDQNSQVAHLRNFSPEPSWSGPLIVLINRLSASASEIVAQCLQDYGRALIIGDETSFGKGTYQRFSLSDKAVNREGEYKVTMGMFYTVSGKSPQFTGVTSDIVVPGVLNHMKIGERHARFPVKNESIAANFKDKLEDVPTFQRVKLQMFYSKELQQRQNTYTPYLKQLKTNSQTRTSQHPVFQLLKSSKDDSLSLEDEETISSSDDFQLQEALHIMQDLLFMQSTGAAKSA